MVCYDGDNFLGELTQVIGELDFEVNVMCRSGGFTGNGHERKARFFYHKENIVKKLKAPDVAGSRGQFYLQGL